MEERHRPVTGYPAPNPNGYAPNPLPPAGSEYPYAAANVVPPTNTYYGYQSNPYYQQDPSYNLRRATWLRRVLAFIIAVVVIFSAIIFIVWLVLRPQLPQFQVDSLSVTNFIVGNDSLVSFSSDFTLSARNPNKKMTLYYNHMEAEFFYELWSLSQTMLPPFSLSTMNETSFPVNFAAAGSFLDGPALNGINNERRRNGNVVFNLRIVSLVRFQAKAWRTRWRLLKVFCGNLYVGIRINETSGHLTSSPRQCSVGI